MASTGVRMIPPPMPASAPIAPASRPRIAVRNAVSADMRGAVIIRGGKQATDVVLRVFPLERSAALKWFRRRSLKRDTTLHEGFSPDGAAKRRTLPCRAAQRAALAAKGFSVVAGGFRSCCCRSLRTPPATVPRPVPDSRCAPTPTLAARAQRVFLVLPALRAPPAHRGQQACSPGPQPQQRPELLPALKPRPAPPKWQARSLIPFAGHRVAEPIHHRPHRLPRHPALRPARRRELPPLHLPVCTRDTTLNPAFGSPYF